jgi:hypothetical protein
MNNTYFLFQIQLHVNEPQQNMKYNLMNFFKYQN